MHSAWTRGRISSLHCQLDTAPWIKLLFFRLLGMFCGEKYISASKAFSKWRQSIKPACKEPSLAMVTFCSLTACASAVIPGEERGFHRHAAKLAASAPWLCWNNPEQAPAVPGGIPAGKQSSSPFPDRARSSEHPEQQQHLASVCLSVLLLSPLLPAFLIFSSRKQHPVLSAAAHVSHYQVIFSFFPREEQIIASLMRLTKMSKKGLCFF